MKTVIIEMTPLTDAQRLAIAERLRQLGHDVGTVSVVEVPARIDMSEGADNPIFQALNMALSVCNKIARRKKDDIVVLALPAAPLAAVVITAALDRIDRWTYIPVIDHGTVIALWVV